MTPEEIAGRLATARSVRVALGRSLHMPNLPTKIIPAKICRLKISGRFPMDMRIQPLNIKTMLESNPMNPES